MKNTKFLKVVLGITFKPYSGFSFSESEKKAINDQYKQMYVSDMATLLEKTKKSPVELSTEEELQRDKITFAIFRRIAASDSDSIGVDSHLLNVNDAKTLNRLEKNKLEKPVSKAVLGLIRHTIPTRHMRHFYQICIEAGFLFQDSPYLFRVLGFDREEIAYRALNSVQEKVA